MKLATMLIEPDPVNRDAGWQPTMPILVESVRDADEFLGDIDVKLAGVVRIHVGLQG